MERATITLRTKSNNRNDTSAKRGRRPRLKCTVIYEKVYLAAKRLDHRGTHLTI
jgi:hypothetical protein